ncbi:MAG: hypothetical protein JW864_13410 [Spirochaetes bacterium]|nr:hypothetical protein [Spirochaetota bacterium]
MYFLELIQLVNQEALFFHPVFKPDLPVLSVIANFIGTFSLIFFFTKPGR